MPFTSFEKSPMVNTMLCHLCFGTGKSKKLPGQHKKELQTTIEKCMYCDGNGYVSSNASFNL